MFPGIRALAVTGLTLLVVAVTTAPALASGSEVAEWHLDALAGPGGQTAFDSSGNGNDLSVLTPGDVTVVPGRFAQAFAFDGAGRANAAANPSLQPQQLTVMAWVNATQSPGSYRYLIADGGNAGCTGSSYALDTGAGGGLEFTVASAQNATVASPAASAGTLWDGNWHAVAGIYDGATVRLYVDGTEVGSGTADSAAIGYQQSTTQDLFVGDYPDSGCAGHAYTGTLDEARVYNRALTASEVNQLQTATGPTPPELGTATVSLTSPGNQVATVGTPVALQIQAADTDGGALSYAATGLPAGLTIDGTGRVTGTPTVAGTSTVTVTAADFTGPSASATFTWTVNPPAGLPALAPVARFVSDGPSLTLKGGAWLNGASSLASPGAQIVNYAWDPSGGGDYSLPCGRSPIISLTFARAGTHTVGLRVTDSLGRVSTLRQRVHVSARMVNLAALSQPVFDCENPAAGNQPDRADCVKTFGWSIIDVNSRGAADQCFTIVPRFRKGALTSVPLPASAAAFSLRNAYYVYHATVPGPVALNGLFIPIPSAVKTQFDTGDGSIGLGRIPINFGSFRTQALNLGTTLAVTQEPGNQCYAKGTEVFHLLDNGLLKGDTTIGGLPVQGGIAIDLGYHTSRTTLNLGLPNIFSLGAGQPAQGALCLGSDNIKGVDFQSASVFVPYLWLGPIEIDRLSLSYNKGQNAWSGGATVHLLPGAPGLDASPPPPDLGFGIRNGAFDHAGIGLDFPLSLQPELFPGIFLTNIHVAIGVDPLRFTGGLGVTAAQIVDINGDVYVAFATPDQQYIFPANGGDLSPLSGRTLSSFTIAVGGNATVHVPFLGGLPLANAYLLYEFPDYFEFGGGFQFQPPLLKITGAVNGFLDGTAGTFNLQGQVSACLRDAIKISIGPFDYNVQPCFTTGAVVSSKGIGFCGTIPGLPIPVTITVGYQWGGSPGIGFFSCDFSGYSVASTHATREAAAGPPGFSLPAGLDAATVRVTGADGAPDVILTSPGGRQISTAVAPGRSNVVIVHAAAANETLIGLRKPLGGRWRVTTAPASVPVTGVAVAQSLPAPRIVARVSGRGSRRTLSYRLAGVPGRQVTFAEHGVGVYRTLGPARAGRGRMSFTPAPGPAARRRILALITEGGTVVRDVVVTSYRAPGPTLLRAPASVHVSRNGAQLAVTWRPVGGAVMYAATLQLADGRRTLLVTRRTHVAFGFVATSLRGRVSVAAIAADGRRRSSVPVPFRALARPRRH